MEERHLVLVGSFGVENAGHDATLEVLTAGLRRSAPDVRWRFTAFSRHPDPELALRAGVEFRPSLEHESRASARGRVFRGFNPGDDRSELRGIEDTLREADLVVVLGGDLLNDEGMDFLRGRLSLLGVFAFLADLHDVPLVMLGASAGALRTRTGRRVAHWLLRRSACTTLRDRTSAARLKELAPAVHLEVVPSLAHALAPAEDDAFRQALDQEGIPAEGERPRLALALRPAPAMGLAPEVLSAALVQLARSYELLFLPQCTDWERDDIEVARSLAEGLGKGAVAHVVRRRFRPDLLLRFYGMAEATLAGRLHGAVFSAMCGVPLVGMAHQGKMASYLEELGAGAVSVDPRRADASSIVQAVERASAAGGESLRGKTRAWAAASRRHLEVILERLGIEVSSADAA